MFVAYKNFLELGEVPETGVLLLCHKKFTLLALIQIDGNISSLLYLSSLAPVIRDCINKYWYLQLIKHKEYHGTNEFRLGRY